MGSRHQGWDAPPVTTGRLEERVVLATVVVVAAALRWHWLGQPIRYDEAVTWLEYASRPLDEALSLYDLPNNHLFHTLLAHLSTEAWGPGVRALRLPAYVAGVLTVPATWALGRRLHGAFAGLLSAALVAVSPVLVLFSTNARGYSILVLAFLVLALLAAELRRSSPPLLWAGFSAAAALAGWTMPAALYPAVGVGLWILWPARHGETVRPLAARASGLAVASVGAAAAAALLYLPVVGRSGWRSVVANRFVAPAPFDAFIDRVPEFLASVPREWAHGLPGWLVAPVVLGAVVAVVRGAATLIEGEGTDGRPPSAVPGSGARPPSLLPAALLGAAVVLLATRRTPFARVWLFLLPAAVVFAAGGLATLARLLSGLAEANPAVAFRRAGQVGAGAALLLLIGGGAHLLRTDPVTSWGLTGSLPDGERVAGLLARRMGPGDAVRAPIPSDAPLEYYFSRMGIDRGRVNDVPEPGACLWIVVNRRHGAEGPARAPTDPAGGTPLLVRDFGASAVYVRPAAEGAAPERPGRPPADGRPPDGPGCGPGGGDAAAPATDSPGAPPAHGGEEPAER